MKSITTTLSINAAFLREIKEDHHELAVRFRILSQHLGAPDDSLQFRRRLVDACWRLRDQLALHFSLEEAFGYFEDALDAAPRLSEQAELLKNQHQQLFLEVCGLVDLAEDALRQQRCAATILDICDRFERFEQRFREHEAREDQLILEAFDDDIGCGD